MRQGRKGFLEFTIFFHLAKLSWEAKLFVEDLAALGTLFVEDLAASGPLGTALNRLC